MKKYFLIIFILVACLHDSLESREMLNTWVNPYSINSSHHNHIDDVFELASTDIRPGHIKPQTIVEPDLIFSQENDIQIWKPPVIH